MTTPIDYKPYLERVTAAVQELGFERISPESLGALGEELARGNYTHVRGAYNMTMHGFRQMFGPVKRYEADVMAGDDEYMVPDTLQFDEYPTQAVIEARLLNKTPLCTRVEIEAVREVQS